MILLKNDFLSCQFDDNGSLKNIAHANMSLPFSGLGFDFGRDEEMVTGMLGYESMLEFRTWNLPDIRPTGKAFGLTPSSVKAEGNSLVVSYDLGKNTVETVYTLCDKYLKADLRITNTTDTVQYMNACAFLLGLNMTEGVVFDFPGNAPIAHCEPSKLGERQPVQTGLINFAVHSVVPGGDLNVLYIDKIEKWGCGVYRDGNETKYVYDAALEMDLKAGETVEVGSLYVLLCAKATDTYAGDGNPFLQIREHVASLGYKAVTSGIHDGVMYSGHPSGTMDAKFPFKDDLFQYAEYLPELKKMGIDHVWLLPVFDHNENGVYHSNDQAIIHERYGGEAGCKLYCDKAHELGMTILFDYVPHGPAPEFPVARDNPEWPSKRRDGSLQDEWECVSMDYNHPGYLEYTTELVHDHVNRFAIDGARIDCAMGGLSNWRPYKDNRPSGNSVLAGVHITEAIREGFIRGGRTPLNMPENFNLIPNYYHCTDLFYGMNLYRAFVDLEHYLKEDPSQYVALLTDFLEREAWITPAELHKMRFLGNHDTVSWVWQSDRATSIYGVDGAKALWAVISFIDGVPMIYQGDEDPSFCCRTGENLTAFFTQLFADRKSFLPKGSNATTYLHTGTPVMAFIREPQADDGGLYESNGSGRVLALVNLSDSQQAVPQQAENGKLLTSSDGASSATAPLAAYSYRLIQL